MASEAATLFVTVNARISGLERGLAKADALGVQAAASLSRSADRASLSFATMGRNAGKMAGQAAHYLKLLSFGAAGALAVSAHAAMTFEAALERVHTQAGASQGEVEKMRGALLKLAPAVGKSPQELAAGLFHLESVGLRGAKALDALKVASQGAAIGNADLESTATALGSAWLVNIKGAGNLHHVMGLLNGAVGAGNMRMQDLVDALGTGILPAAKEAGLSIKDVLGALAVFTDEGYQASSAAAQFATALHFFTNPTNKAKAALESIGMKSTDMARDMHKPQGMLVALTDLHNHLKKLGTIKSEEVLGNILPGGRGRIMLTLLNQLDRYQMKLGQVGQGEKNFGEAWVKTKQTTAQQLHELEATVSSFGITVGEMFLPMANKGLKPLKDAVLDVEKVFGRKDLTGGQKFNLGFEKLKQDLAPLGHEIEQGINAAAPGVTAAGIKLGAGALHAVMQGFESSVGGRFVMSAWLFTKLGGFGAFRALGSGAGRSMAAGMAAGASAGAPAIASTFRGRLRATFAGVGKGLITTQAILGGIDEFQAIAAGKNIGDSIQKGLSTFSFGVIPDPFVNTWADQISKDFSGKLGPKLHQAFSGAIAQGSSSVDVAKLSALGDALQHMPKALVTPGLRNLAKDFADASYQAQRLSGVWEKLPHSAKLKFFADTESSRAKISKLGAAAIAVGQGRRVIQILTHTNGSEETISALHQLLVGLPSEKKIRIDVSTYLHGATSIPGGGGFGGLNKPAKPAPRTPSHGQVAGVSSAVANPYMDLTQSDIESILSDTQSQADDLARRLHETTTVGSGKKARKENTLKGAARTRAQARLRKLNARLGQLHPAERHATLLALGFSESDVAIAAAESTAGTSDDQDALKGRIAKDTSRIEAIKRKLRSKRLSRQHRIDLNDELAGLISDRSGRQTSLDELTNAVKPTAAAFAQMNAATARLTSTMADDVQAAKDLVAARKDEYDAAVASGDPAKITDAANNLADATDNLSAVQNQTPPGWQHGQADLALAGITKTPTDDIAVIQNELLPIAQSMLDAAKAAGDDAGIIQWAGEVSSLNSSIDSLNQNVAGLNELPDLLKQQIEQLQNLYNVSQAEDSVLRRAITRTAAEGMGARVGLSGSTPTRSVAY